MAVFVVAKKARVGFRISSGERCGPDRAIAGAKARILSTALSSRHELKSCPVTSSLI